LNCVTNQSWAIAWTMRDAAERQNLLYTVISRVEAKCTSNKSKG